MMSIVQPLSTIQEGNGPDSVNVEDACRARSCRSRTAAPGLAVSSCNVPSPT